MLSISWLWPLEGRAGCYVCGEERENHLREEMFQNDSTLRTEQLALQDLARLGSYAHTSI